QLILGGARSGKSHLAEKTAKQLSVASQRALHYVATALPFDQEMRERIAHHQKQRGGEWQEHECPLHLSELLTNFAITDVVLIDCLTLWLNNWIFELGDECSNETLEAEIEKLIKIVRGSD
ncbi:bifunctional adenosylcobinamide kinase/adenosylcobinamide-phosphate guanylyltransferase, partial [Vibrio parahaemolyticus]|uniref:bifunctional adenosylcobinamide kinase/adenosylcobinamide-phosphate guanylyltransferase n=1 Tax=Vibrio parahaemolyticus TaxID=670 RepID=UPI00146BFE9D